MSVRCFVDRVRKTSLVLPDRLSIPSGEVDMRTAEDLEAVELEEGR